MNFLETIWDRLERSADELVLEEARGQTIFSVTGRGLKSSIRAARVFLAQAGLKQGDRCALLAPNSIRWTALDLAMMAEGIIVVPLYARQAPCELVAMMKDCSPRLVCCGDAALREAIAENWLQAPPLPLFDEIFAGSRDTSDVPDDPRPLAETDPVTIIYTSGTSGQAKGVVLAAGNVGYVLGCTNARLDLLMGPQQEPDRVLHYLPCCFAGSWILLLTCLSRSSVLALSTDLNRLAEEIRLAAPHYFLNVPALLERMRAAVDQEFLRRGGLANRLYQNARAAWFRRRSGRNTGLDPLWLAAGDRWLFPAVRRKLGANLRALICGSAPLASETQLFFRMLGVPVLQVYGLTETTAICTMDHPHQVEPGRVGPAIPGVEMKLGANDEILVRGPNIFPGYWNRPEETAEVLQDGWFHTGDQGDVDDSGNWRIIGRLKNLIILSSGHNIAPEPIEDRLRRALPGAQQVMLVGNNRSYLAALVAGAARSEQVAAALETINAQLPHYQRIRVFHLLDQPFSVENGLLTANGKLKRDAIAAALRDQIEQLYRRPGE